MKLLVVAYEFPPSPSPQSLRWAYLASEIARRGHEIHVFAPDLHYGALDTPFDLDGVTVHRVHPGPVKGFISRLLAASRDGNAADPCAPTEPVRGDPRTRLNWKGKAHAMLERAISSVVFPDHRGLWNLWSAPAFGKLLRELRPDAVIASHEPANTLRFGLAAGANGSTWVADLGDPVLAPYTPRQWRRRALALEREVCVRSDAVVVTNERTRQTLIERHGVAPDKVWIVPQGAPDRSPRGLAAPVQSATLDLVYTGAFYPFRPAEPLLQAVAQSDGVRLRIACARPPESAVQFAERYPDRIALCGHLAHGDSLALQAGADILVNIGNLLPAQVPGKLFEYLSSGRPILQLRAAEDDAGADLVASLRRGWTCWNSADAIGPVLQELRARKTAGRLAEGLDLSDAPIAPYRWSALAMRYLEVIAGVRRSHINNGERR